MKTNFIKLLSILLITSIPAPAAKADVGNGLLVGWMCISPGVLGLGGAYVSGLAQNPSRVVLQRMRNVFTQRKFVIPAALWTTVCAGLGVTVGASAHPSSLAEVRNSLRGVIPENALYDLIETIHGGAEPGPAIREALLAHGWRPDDGDGDEAVNSVAREGRAPAVVDPASEAPRAPAQILEEAK